MALINSFPKIIDLDHIIGVGNLSPLIHNAIEFADCDVLNFFMLFVSVLLGLGLGGTASHNYTASQGVDQ